MREQVQKIIGLWSQYRKGADQMEAKAAHTGSADAMRKAVSFRVNEAKLAIWLSQNAMVKAFPLQGRLRWRGMQISIENKAGSVRHWQDKAAGRDGYTYMLNDYGYLRGTEGVDNDGVDVYLGPDPEKAPYVFVIRQLKAPDFKYYDEDKCMIGFASEEAAADAYRSHYDDPRFLGIVDTYPVNMFVAAVKVTKKAPAPVGGWLSLRVQQRMADLIGTSALPKEAVIFAAENAPPAMERPGLQKKQEALVAVWIGDSAIGREAAAEPEQPIA